MTSALCDAAECMDFRACEVVFFIANTEREYLSYLPEHEMHLVAPNMDMALVS